MTTLVANLPATKVWVRREYLRDLRDGHGEYTLGYWVTCKSLTGRALYFETYLTSMGRCMTNYLSVLFFLGIPIILINLRLLHLIYL